MKKAIEDFKTHVPFDFILNHPVDQNVSIFHRADLFVAAEKGTGWANTVAEAMASGIGSIHPGRYSGYCNTRKNGHAGMQKCVEGIAKGIEKMIKYPGLRMNWPCNARKHIEQYDWQILADRIISWYESKEKEVS